MTDRLDRWADPPLLVLASLAGGPKHGYAMLQDIEQFCGTHLEVGTLYGALARLEKQGWIEALEPVERRRPYQLTHLGITVLRNQLATMNQVVTTGQQRLATI